ncbi:hypothetical protein Q3G72_026265 [Acer saccharum]|nr:hypothetical protein Q3G72_026265 [Acer saccharum]
MTYVEIEAESEDTILRTKQAKKKRAKKKRGKVKHNWEEKLGGPKTNKKLKFCCEICGYCHWNRNAFEEHSMSRSHVEGLGDREDKELFKGITKLEEANGLYIAQIKRSVDFLWNPEFEEFEDEDGNLFTKKFTHRYVQNEQDKSWKEVVEVEVEREYK